MQSKILKLPDVMKACALSRSSIYAFINEGKFPAPISLGERARGWIASEIEEWIEGRVKQSRQSPSQRGA